MNTQPSLLTLLEPVDRTTQVTRMPGDDAPCDCDRKPCAWPFCTPHRPDDERTTHEHTSDQR